jgi:hypothetical protein
MEAFITSKKSLYEEISVITLLWCFQPFLRDPASNLKLAGADRTA